MQRGRITKKFKTKIYTGSGENCIACGKSLLEGQKYVEIKEADIKGIKTHYKVGKYHAQCLAKRNYFIAFLDILGFTRFVQNHSLYKMYEKIQEMFAAARAANTVMGTVRVNNITKTIILANIPYLAIFDSIIVYQEVIPHVDTEDELEWKERAFGEFIIGMEELYKEAFKRRIFLRGGISLDVLIIL